MMVATQQRHCSTFRALGSLGSQKQRLGASEYAAAPQLWDMVGLAEELGTWMPLTQKRGHWQWQREEPRGSEMDSVACLPIWWEVVNDITQYLRM
jgi:hypothetical protein